MSPEATQTRLPAYDLFEAIEGRRSVKHYDPNHVMTSSEVNQLMEATLLSPTSFNMQNWRFVCVQNQALKADIQAASWNQAQVGDCSLLVILCADLNAHAHSPERYWENASESLQKTMAAAIPRYYEGNSQLQRDEAMRSCGIAGQTLMLAAKAMGYDTCPMVGFDFQKVATLINLPEDHIITFMVTVGKALKPANPRGGQLPLSEVMIRDRF